MTELDPRASTAPPPGGTPAGWRWWPEVLLRGAGFPAQGALDLASPRLAELADRLRPDEFGRGQAWSTYVAEFHQAANHLVSVMQQIAQREDFRRALAWQNPDLLATALGPLLRWTDSQTRGSKHRQHEEAVASYWHRYCAKNDSIGFFGPVAWGTLDFGQPTRVSVGQALVAVTNVFFEPWAIMRMAQAFERESGMHAWLKPRRMGYLVFAGDGVLSPLGVIKLPRLEAEVLRVCDGTVAARDIAARISEEHLDQPCSADDVKRAVSSLEKRRLLTCKIDIPITVHPEEDLREFLLTVRDDALRRSCLTRLDLVESSIELIRESAGESRRLAQAVAKLGETFSAVTDEEPTRRKGQTYAGRGLVYSDCRRDVEFVLGYEFRDGLAALELLTESGRWFCWHVGEAVREILGAVFRDCQLPDGVPLATFLFKAEPRLRKSLPAILERVASDLIERWEEIIHVEPGESRLTRRYEDVAPLVRDAFKVPGSGWEGARYMSPDIMVVAGRKPMLVLGEMHMAINTMRHYCFVSQHPDSVKLFDCLNQDLPQPRLFPTLPRESLPRLTIRTHPALIRPADYMVEHLYRTAGADREHLFMSSQLQVREQAGNLTATCPDGMTFDVLDVFGEVMMDAVIDCFRMFRVRPHMPRIAIGSLVVSREQWRFRAEDLAFSAVTDEARRFALARAWCRDQGLPRQVFVRTGRGEKPVLVDFASPVCVTILSRIVRRLNDAPENVRWITMQEMLPAVNQLWLSDAEHREYTSEFRLAAFDLRG
jgi:Lantibiotic dehydratase, N terminus